MARCCFRRSAAPTKNFGSANRTAPGMDRQARRYPQGDLSATRGERSNCGRARSGVRRRRERRRQSVAHRCAGDVQPDGAAEPGKKRNGAWNFPSCCGAPTSSSWATTMRPAAPMWRPRRRCLSAPPHACACSILRSIGLAFRSDGDVSDWFSRGHTREELDALIAQAPDYGEKPEVWRAPTAGAGISTEILT